MVFRTASGAAHGRLPLGLVPGAGLLLVLVACAEPPSGAGRPPAIALSGMTLRHYPVEGSPRVARADAVTYDRNTGVVAGEEIDVDLPPGKEFRRGGARISVEKAQGDVQGRGAAAQGPIRVVTGMGDVGTTTGSTWDGEQDLLWGDEPVRVEGPGYALAGNSYRYHADEQRLALEGGVEFRSRPPASGPEAPPPLDVRSPRLTVHHRERRAVFGGGVVLTQGDLVVRCPELVAFYDAASRIERVVCSDEVRAEQGVRTMEAGSGEFDNAGRTLTLRGEPVIREGERWIRGETMVWEVDRRRARVEKGEAELPAADLPPVSGRSTAGPLHVVASEILYEADARKAHFDGDVVARRGGMTLRANRLVAVAAEDGSLDSAWTEAGPVTVVEGRRQARSGKAHFLGNGQRLVLTGQPKLTEGDSFLEGERVIFHVGLDRVEVERPRAAFPLDRAAGRSEK